MVDSVVDLLNLLAAIFPDIAFFWNESQDDAIGILVTQSLS